MKKLLLIIAAIFTLNSVSAELILHESFNRAAGTLNSGAIPSSTTITDTENWYTKNANATKVITVVEGSLSYPNYATAGTGNKALLITANSSLSQDMRMLKTTVDKGKIYLSAIINIDELNKTDNGVKGTGAYCLCFGEGSTSASKLYARLYIRSVKEGDEYVGFQMGVAKNNETTAGTAWTETIYKEKTDYLVVLEYEKVDGLKNDTARLYVNPTKNTTTPTLTCIQSAVNSSGTEQGACGKEDAGIISSIHLNETLKNNPNRLYIDEIKVATSWEELFDEGGDTPIEENPEITAPTNLSFGGQVYAGVAATTTFTVKGKNLKGDITLVVNNDEITLSKTTIAKADAESEAGVEVTATLLPVKDGFQTASITLSSQDATAATINSSWYTYETINLSTIAAINDEAAKVSDETYVVYTGTAYVTYTSSETISGSTSNFVYIQDNTAAIKIMNMYWGDVRQGDEVTKFALTLTNPTASLLPIATLPAISILSHDNNIASQVVTLAELKANPTDYLNELVKVEDVTLDQTSTTFGKTNDDNSIIPDYITQNGVQATIKLTNNNELIGTTKPKTADLIGLSTSSNGSAICVRGASDIISKDNPTAIDNVAMDELLSGEYEVYTVSGQRIDALQSGVNIIRKGNTTYKVVR